MALSHLLDLPVPARSYLGSDNQPALECDVMAWLREREGLPAIATPAGAETGRRVCNARLVHSGWAAQHGDFRSGYLPLLAMPGV